MVWHSWKQADRSMVGAAGGVYRRALQGFRREYGRRWSSTSKPSPSGTSSSSSGGAGNAAAGVQQQPIVVSASVRSATPGMVRITKGFGAEKHEAEVDSTIARIIGSDWGDRSHQPVSLPMRIYWVIFFVVLGNGVFTYLAGKDEQQLMRFYCMMWGNNSAESFVVEKLRKKADEKLGIVETEDEFVAMAGGDSQLESISKKQTAAATAEQPVAKPEVAKQTTAVAKSAPTSMLNSSVASPGMSFFSPAVTSASNARRPKSKAELEHQLAQLRLQQENLQQQIQRVNMSSAELEELEHQVRMLDIQKGQVKRIIKSF
ncbi:hypothetical protein BBJ28_00007383 [Nothophytophthora sp. Chile5]|nr:hypothetical protein BBJ28_00007383 [Nothophytophthora sp. Chile5]